MRFRLTHQLPAHCLVAVSGGADSMAVWHFLSRSRKVAGVVHVNHNTGSFADEAETLVRIQARSTETPFHYDLVEGKPTDGESPESFWRERRYEIFDRVHKETNLPIVLAHHLNDCLEEYLICALVRGYIGTIPYQRGGCIRPFRLWPKKSILEYTKQHDIPFLQDPSNTNKRFLRNRIRESLVHQVLTFINPGIYSLVEKAICDQDRRSEYR